jgi:hypothetical protein
VGASVAQLTAETLLNLGFRDVAKWLKTDNGSSIGYELGGANASAHRAMFDVRNALYAFVQDDNVNYSGKTTRSIKKRFVGYCNPGSTQQTNQRCHKNIKALLKRGIEIGIFAFTPISDPLSLSETQSDWQVEANWVMLFVDERCLQPDLVGADRIVPVASVAAS